MSLFQQEYQQMLELGRLARLAELCQELEDEDDEESSSDEDVHESPSASAGHSQDRDYVRRAERRRNRVLPPLPPIEVRRNPPEPKELDRDEFRAEFFFQPEDFEVLFRRMEPFISKQDTQLRMSIPARLRLQATIKYLMGAVSFSTLEADIGIPRSTLSRLIPSVCEAIWQVLYKECIVLPPDQNVWIEKAQEFEELCQYPYSIGVLDGKLIKGHAYFKGTYSIILLALVDAKHQFMFIEVGDPCPGDDSKVWHSSTLKRALEDGNLHLPLKQGPITHHFISHDTYPLTDRMMKPYTRQGPLQVIEQMFNFRFARARRATENAFGILAHRFRVLRTPIAQKFENAVKTIKAAVVLHNYILQNCNQDGSYLSLVDLRREDEDGNLLEGSWEHEGAISNLVNLGNQFGNRFTTKSAMEHRDTVAKSMVNDNLVPTQFKFTMQQQEIPTVQFILIQ